MSPPRAGTPSDLKPERPSLRLDNLATRVVTAVGTDAVRQLGLPALRASRVGRSLDAPMGAAHPHLRSRLTSLGYRHRSSLSGFQPLPKGGKRRPAGIHVIVPARASRGVEIRAASGAQALAVGAAEWIQRQSEGHRVPQHRLEIRFHPLELVALLRVLPMSRDEVELAHLE